MKPKIFFESIQTDDNTTRIPNQVLQDTKISFRARGVLAFLLSVRSRFEVTDNWHKNQINDTPTGIMMAVRELGKAGYAVCKPRRLENGKIEAWIWTFGIGLVTENTHDRPHGLNHTSGENSRPTHDRPHGLNHTSGETDGRQHKNEDFGAMQDVARVSSPCTPSFPRSSLKTDTKECNRSSNDLSSSLLGETSDKSSRENSNKSVKEAITECNRNVTEPLELSLFPPCSPPCLPATTPDPVGQDAADVVKVWNERSGGVKVRNLSPGRQSALRARLRNQFWVDNWRAAIDKIATSKFCHGQNDRGWKADIDFFIRPDTISKVLEGKYDNRPVAKRLYASAGGNL